MTVPTSYRLSDDLKQRLSERAAVDNMSETALVSRLLDEGLRAAAHPGIVFREGPSGRRASLIGGPDVWEVIAGLRTVEGSGEAKIANAAEMFGLPANMIRIAVEYAADNAAEIQHDIALNDAVAERIRTHIAERDRLLAS